MGTTKQAASKLVVTMIDTGYVVHGRSSGDGRERPVHLTVRGRQLLASVERIYDELERSWAGVIGAAGVQRPKRDVARVLRATSGGELPPVRPTW
jgi:DNA-binding MarR family transcriptional regulator